MGAWRHRFWLIAALAAGLAFGLTACGPEADRERGGGAGADIGNRDAGATPVALHGEVPPEDRIYHDTPLK